MNVDLEGDQGKDTFLQVVIDRKILTGTLG